MRYLRLFLCLLAPAVLLLLGCGGGADSAPVQLGQLDGHVYTTAQGGLTLTRAAGVSPLAGATVVVQGTTLSATTDADGYFLLNGVPTGLRTVVISRTGYQRLALTVSVAANVKVTLADGVLNPAPRKWTVLVYLNAANNLETFGLQDVNEMEQVPTNDQVAVVVQMKRSSQEDTSDGNWKTTRRFLIVHDEDTGHMTSASAPTMEDLGYGIDMGLSSTLADFIAWGRAQYPAEHYLLVVWNHGSGCLKAGAAPSRSVSFDDDTGHNISTTQLARALSAAPPLDLVAFDACQMQMLEVAYEIRHACDYMVGSEEDSPQEGYAYQTWLGPLAANPGMTPRDLATTMARETLQAYGTASTITHSVIDTSQVAALASAVDAFAGELLAYAKPTMPIAQARNSAEYFTYDSYRDLYHYTDLVAAAVNHPRVTAAASAVKAALTQAVVAEYHGIGHPNVHGVSIFISPPQSFSREAGAYLPLAFARETRWDEWLEAQPAAQ